MFSACTVLWCSRCRIHCYVAAPSFHISMDLQKTSYGYGSSLVPGWIHHGTWLGSCCLWQRVLCGGGIVAVINIISITSGGHLCHQVLDLAVAKHHNRFAFTATPGLWERPRLLPYLFLKCGLRLSSNSDYASKGGVLAWWQWQWCNSWNLKTEVVRVSSSCLLPAALLKWLHNSFTH